MIISLYNVNYDVDEQHTLIGYFDDIEKVKKYIELEWLRIKPVSHTELLAIEPSKYKWYERYDYVSCYGNYNCSYELRPVEHFNPKHFLDDVLNTDDNMKIKDECEKMYTIIEKSQKRLKELRNLCKHEKVIEGNYSYRVGVLQKALYCDDCGEVIKYL